MPDDFFNCVVQGAENFLFVDDGGACRNDNRLRLYDVFAGKFGAHGIFPPEFSLQLGSFFGSFDDGVSASRRRKFVGFNSAVHLFFAKKFRTPEHERNFNARLRRDKFFGCRDNVVFARIYLAHFDNVNGFRFSRLLKRDFGIGMPID